MGARKQIARKQSNSAKVNGILFFNCTFGDNTQTVKRHAIKFSKTSGFTSSCAYYDVKKDGEKFVFIPVGKSLKTAA